MKRRIVVAAAAVFAMVAASASELVAQTTKPVRIGVLGGVSIATLSTDLDGLFELDSRIGASGGAQLILPLSNSIGVEVDALYSMKGAKFEVGAFGATGRLDYLEVPVLLRLDVASSSTVTPFVVLGPSFAYRVGCSLQGNAFGFSASLGCERLENALSTKFKSFDAGAVIGGGLDFAAGKNTVSLGARYTYGLTDIGDVGSVRNRAFSILAGVSMPLGR